MSSDMIRAATCRSGCWVKRSCTSLHAQLQESIVATTLYTDVTCAWRCNLRPSATVTINETT
eukprot:1813592-Amphidinium_carterae.1